MLWTLKGLIEHCNSTLVLIDGHWYPARPLRWPFWWRARVALMVLRGDADAVVWPEDDASHRAASKEAK